MNAGLVAGPRSADVLQRGWLLLPDVRNAGGEAVEGLLPPVSEDSGQVL